MELKQVLLLFCGINPLILKCFNLVAIKEHWDLKTKLFIIFQLSEGM